jgi:hypothetical protein
MSFFFDFFWLTQNLRQLPFLPIAPPLDPKEYRKFTLVDKVVCSPNTAM